MTAEEFKRLAVFRSALPLDQHPGERLDRPVLLLGLALVARRSKKAESCRFRNVTPTTNAARNIQYPRRRRYARPTRRGRT
jgi:hypothetical protein